MILPSWNRLCYELPGQDLNLVFRGGNVMYKHYTTMSIETHFYHTWICYILYIIIYTWIMNIYICKKKKWLGRGSNSHLQNDETSKTCVLYRQVTSQFLYIRIYIYIYIIEGYWYSTRLKLYIFQFFLISFLSMLQAIPAEH